jgi:hypothetical protein
MAALLHDLYFRELAIDHLQLDELYAKVRQVPDKHWLWAAIDPRTKIVPVYYNARRPHQGLKQDSPLGLEAVSTQGPIRCRNVLGGIVRDYYREAA